MKIERDEALQPVWVQRFSTPAPRPPRTECKPSHFARGKHLTPGQCDDCPLRPVEEPCIHPGVFATGSPSEHCWTCNKDIPMQQL